jgi:hypothetical protein
VHNVPREVAKENIAKKRIRRNLFSIKEAFQPDYYLNQAMDLAMDQSQNGQAICTRAMNRDLRIKLFAPLRPTQVHRAESYESLRPPLYPITIDKKTYQNMGRQWISWLG